MNQASTAHVLPYDDEPGRAVRAWVDVPPHHVAGRSRPCVVVVHGFKGFAHWGFFPELARRLTQAGFLAVRMNTSGSGIGNDPLVMDDEQGFAANTVSRQVEDLEHLRSWIAAGGVPDADLDRLGLVGHSMGGGVGLVHAARHGGWRAIVTWAAVSRFVRVSPQDLERWRAEGELVFVNARTGQEQRLGIGWVEDVERAGEALDPVRACSRLTTPTLLVHGTDDESVPLAEGRALARAIPSGVGRLVAVEGAGHTFGAVHPLLSVPSALEDVLGHTLGHFEHHLGTRDL